MWVDEEKQQQQQQHRSSSSSNNSKVVLPGEPLHLGEGFLLGLNTYVENGVARSSVCGVVQTVNRLVYVRALKSRYEANVGDVVVGRVTDIANGKWYLDVGASRLAVLSVAAVCLDVQRRRDDADVLEMRSLFQPYDLLCCEVQKVQNDGTILLHTRSSRYGRLMKGLGVQVSPQLIKRQSKHIEFLQCGLQIILGVNGYLWVSVPSRTSSGSEGDAAVAAAAVQQQQQQQQEEKVPLHLRHQLAMARNIILCLARRGLKLSVNRINCCMQLAAKLLLKPQMLLQQQHADLLIKKLAEADAALLNP